MSVKLSSNDEQYITELESKRLKMFSKELASAEEEKTRFKTPHWMRCPKDGSILKEVTSRGILVDVCPTCNGLWLDARELEAWKQRIALDS